VGGAELLSPLELSAVLLGEHCGGSHDAKRRHHTDHLPARQSPTSGSSRLSWWHKKALASSLARVLPPGSPLPSDTTIDARGPVLCHELSLSESQATARDNTPGKIQLTNGQDDPIPFQIEDRRAQFE
jgi:hypothetical protein